MGTTGRRGGGSPPGWFLGGSTYSVWRPAVSAGGMQCCWPLVGRGQDGAQCRPWRMAPQSRDAPARMSRNLVQRSESPNQIAPLAGPPTPDESRWAPADGAASRAWVRTELLSLRPWDRVKGVSRRPHGVPGVTRSRTSRLRRGREHLPSERARAALFQRPGDAGPFSPSI